MTKMKSLVITIATFVLTFSALINAASACTLMHYQPKLPNALKK